MQSMDTLTTLDNPLVPTLHGPEEALQQLQQLQLDIREQVMSSASKGDSFDSTERTVWETVRRIGYAAMELLVQLQGTGDLGEQLTTAEGQRLHRSEVSVHERSSEFRGGGLTAGAGEFSSAAPA